MYEQIWSKIRNYLKNNVNLLTLSSVKSQSVTVERVEDGYVILRFNESNRPIKIVRERFLSGYKMLEDNKGKFVPIGASRTNTKLLTLEGAIKAAYNGKENGLSTAPWVASILVRAVENIEFNGKTRGQAIRIKH